MVHGAIEPAGERGICFEFAAVLGGRHGEIDRWLARNSAMAIRFSGPDGGFLFIVPGLVMKCFPGSRVFLSFGSRGSKRTILNGVYDE